MKSVGHSAMAGMVLASARSARSAYNVANVNTPSQAPSVERVESVQPRRTQPLVSAGLNSGVNSESSLDSGPVYHAEPSAPQAASSSDTGAETMAQIRATNAFRANLAMLKADDDRVRRQLNLRA